MNQSANTQSFISLTSDGKLTKKILQNGIGELTPRKDQEVFIYYIGKIKDGSEFDSHQKENYSDPFRLSLKAGAFVKGLDIGLLTMKKGEIALFQMNSEYGFGQNVVYDLVPSFSTIQYQINLVDFRDMEGVKIKLFQTDSKNTIPKADNCKEKGNFFYKSNQYEKAVFEYQLADQYLLEIDQQFKAEAQTLRMAIYNNLSQVYINLKQDQLAMEYCSKVLELDPNNKKGLYRRGILYQNRLEYAKAKEDFQKVLQSNPDCQEAQIQLQIIEQIENNIGKPN